jgi:hypothetical protein
VSPSRFKNNSATRTRVRTTLTLFKTRKMSRQQEKREDARKPDSAPTQSATPTL